MQLTKLQAKALTNFRTFRNDAPTFANQMRRAWWFYLMIAVMALGCAAIGYFLEQPWVGGLGIGMALGIYFRDDANVHRFSLLWPALAEVIDWAKLDQLLESANKD